ncbi:unnamed protein product [Caenorhabditis brenneri]
MPKVLYFLIFLIILVVFSNFFGGFGMETRRIKKLQRETLLNSQRYQSELLIAARGSPSFEDLQNFYEKVKMEAYCGNLVSIGKPGEDGSKYVCNPMAVKRRNCTLLSLGLNNQIGYDQNIIEATGGHCLILGADKDLQNIQTRKSYANIGGELFIGKIPTELTIDSMLEKVGRKEVEVAKVDIEGGEFTGLEPFLRKYHVCQILIEVHGTPADHLRMLQIMAKYGFRLYNIDKNVICPACCEYSLINKKCIGQFGVVPLADTIPAGSI